MLCCLFICLFACLFVFCFRGCTDGAHRLIVRMNVSLSLTSTNLTDPILQAAVMGQVCVPLLQHLDWLPMIRLWANLTAVFVPGMRGQPFDHRPYISIHLGLVGWCYCCCWLCLFTAHVCLPGSFCCSYSLRFLCLVWGGTHSNLNQPLQWSFLLSVHRLSRDWRATASQQTPMSPGDMELSTTCPLEESLR